MMVMMGITVMAVLIIQCIAIRNTHTNILTMLMCFITMMSIITVLRQVLLFGFSEGSLRSLIAAEDDRHLLEELWGLDSDGSLENRRP